MLRTGSVLVTGATGNTGSGLVPSLLGAGAQVRALVRDEAKAEPLRHAGADLVVGDLDRIETLEAAVEGVDAIYLLTWNGPTQARQVHNLLQVAARTGMPHVVRHSMWGPSNSRIIRQGDDAEDAVKESGLPWTILKPTFFMQNTLMAARSVASDGMIYWDTGDGEIAMLDVRDVVDVAVAVLTGSGHEGKSYILTGSEAISFHDVAATLSRVLGKEVRYVSVPSEAAFASMVGIGVSEWVAAGYGELMIGFAEGFASHPTDDVSILTGRPARTFEQFARDHAQVFAG